MTRPSAEQARTKTLTALYLQLQQGKIGIIYQRLQIPKLTSMYEFVFHIFLLSRHNTYVYINSLVKFEGGFS